MPVTGGVCLPGSGTYSDLCVFTVWADYADRSLLGRNNRVGLSELHWADSVPGIGNLWAYMGKLEVDKKLKLSVFKGEICNFTNTNSNRLLIFQNKWGGSYFSNSYIVQVETFSTKVVR